MRRIKPLHFFLCAVCSSALFADTEFYNFPTKVAESNSLKNSVVQLRDRIESIKRRQSAMNQDMDEFRDRINKLMIQSNKQSAFEDQNNILDLSLLSSSTKRPEVRENNDDHIADEPESFDAELVYQQDSTVLPQDPIERAPEPQENQEVIASGELIQSPQTKRNSVGFYVGACFPHDVDLNGFGKAQFSPGFQFEAEYRRSFGSFFTGLSFGTKFYEIEKVYNLPSTSLLMAIPGVTEETANEMGNMITLEGSRDGKNYLFNAGLLFGGKYNFSDKFFINGRFSFGYAHTKHKINFANNSMKASDDYLYLSLLNGLGWQINETASLMLYYMLDGHGKSDIYGSQLYSNTGLRLGIDF